MTEQPEHKTDIVLRGVWAVMRGMDQRGGQADQKTFANSPGRKEGNGAGER